MSSCLEDPLVLDLKKTKQKTTTFKPLLFLSGTTRSLHLIFISVSQNNVCDWQLILSTRNLAADFPWFDKDEDESGPISNLGFICESAELWPCGSHKNVQMVKKAFFQHHIVKYNGPVLPEEE